RLDARRRDALGAGDARRHNAPLRPGVRDRRLLPALVRGGPEALLDRPLRLQLAPERPGAVGVEPALARRPARRPDGRDDRRHLGRRARGPAAPLARAPPGATAVREPGRDGGHARRARPGAAPPPPPRTAHAAP